MSRPWPRARLRAHLPYFCERRTGKISITVTEQQPATSSPSDEAADAAEADEQPQHPGLARLFVAAALVMFLCMIALLMYRWATI